MGLALQEKHVSDANRRFGSLLRGHVVEIEGGEPRGDGLALGEGSRVRVVAEPGRPVPGPDRPANGPDATNGPARSE